MPLRKRKDEEAQLCATPSPEVRELSRRQRIIERRVRFIEAKLGILREPVGKDGNHAA